MSKIDRKNIYLYKVMPCHIFAYLCSLFVILDHSTFKDRGVKNVQAPNENTGSPLLGMTFYLSRIKTNLVSIKTSQF